MRIGIDASRANIIERTGTEWYAFYIIKEWITKNPFHEHEVFLYVREPLLDDFPQLPSNWKVKILPWRTILWTQLRLSIEMLFSAPEVLFVPAHTIPLVHPKKTYTTIHDIGFETTQYVYEQDTVARLHKNYLKLLANVFVRIFTLGVYGANELDYQRFSVRLAIRKAKGIFTVSEFSRLEIEKTFPKHPEIFVAYNGIQHSDFYFPYPNETIHKLKQHLNLDSYILSLGRVEKKKNSLQLLKGFHAFIQKNKDEHTKLVFAGGPGVGYKEVQLYVEKEGLSDRVIFLGWVNQNEIPPLIAGCKLFAQLSEYEGFGVPVVQAMALGVPILVNTIPVFEEIAGDSIFYCDAHNTKKVSRAIRTILHSPLKELSEMQQKAISKSKSFNWEDTAKKIAQRLLA